MADGVQASKLEEEVQEEESRDDDENDEDEDDDNFGEEAEYIVEAILDHRADFLDGKVRYQVKWTGYEDESDTTWEPEESFVGAREILEGYWEKVGGKPTPAPSKPTAKKRGRQSVARNNTPNGGAAKKHRKSGDYRSGEADASTKKKKSPASNHDDELNSPNLDEYTDILGPEEWTPPRASNGAWEESVQTVETVEADNDGVLWVFLSWNEKNKEGRFLRNKVKATICYKACPQKMLKFFERHLVLPEDELSPARKS
ncbi:hypothetical protein MMC31_006194 [Peltigera leucophlebia]|nr:hypothetical protein [Peltigera leucophlebia]